MAASAAEQWSSMQPMANDYSIRPARTGDETFLWRMLCEAAYWRSEVPKPSQVEMLTDEHLLRYVPDWESHGDIVIIAEDQSNQPIGAAWFRLYSTDQPGYGFLDEFTPELSVGVEARSRGKGIGTALLNTLLREAAASGFKALSLSVSTDNPVVNLYERLGFVKVKLVEGSWTMRHGILDSE